MTTRKPASARKPAPREGNLHIPLPFEDAVKAALEVEPPPKKPRKPRAKKKA